MDSQVKLQSWLQSAIEPVMKEAITSLKQSNWTNTVDVSRNGRDLILGIKPQSWWQLQLIDVSFCIYLDSDKFQRAD